MLIRKIASLIKERNNYQFTIRLHPNENLAIEEIAQAQTVGISVTKGVPIFKQMSEHDVVTTQYSSAGVEALLAGKALVSMNWVSNDEIIPYAREGVAEFSQSETDFLDTIDRAIITHTAKKSAIKTFLKNHVHHYEAMERLIDLIKVNQPYTSVSQCKEKNRQENN
jgi:hypothetical protein